MPARPSTIDEYLAAVRDDQRAVLEKLRKTVHAAAPGAEECISYGLPAFRHSGKHLVAFGAGKNHCSFFPMDSSTVAAFKDELKGFETSKGTIRFHPDKPLPAVLVRKVVKARLSGNKAQAKRNPAKAVTREDPAVARFIRSLRHPLKPVLEAIRDAILAVSPGISEGIKWNSPSFRTTEWFATTSVHGKDTVRLILHCGAKVRATSKSGIRIADPLCLLKWLGKDRALVTFSGKEGKSKLPALKAVIRQWIRHV